MPSKLTSSLNLRQTVFVTLVLMLTSVALGAGALHILRWRADSRGLSRVRAWTVADTLTPQLAPLVTGDDPRMLRDWLRTQIRQEDLLLVGVAEPGREPTLLETPDANLQKRLADEFAAGRSSFVKRIEADDEQGRRVAVECIRRPIFGTSDGRSAYLMLAMRAQTDRLRFEATIRTFVLPLVGVSITGLVLGFWWLRRQVLAPLDQLARFARNPLLIERESLRGPLDVADPIGGIARALQMLHTDLQEWRERVAGLERQIDRHVEAKTNEMTKALKNIARQVCIDPLTGLHNRRALDERFARLFEQHRDGGHDLSVVMIDIDNFKSLNDSCGHAAGDSVLQFVGQLLQQSTRGTDLAVRYGGDEFALVLTGVNARGAAQIAARVVALFGQHARLVPTAPRPSLSAGVASIRVHQPKGAADLIQMADTALYAAKSVGKAVVRMYDPQLQEALPASSR